MSKAKLKRFLSSLTKEQIIEIMLDLYDVRKEAKNYLEFHLASHSGVELARCKSIIEQEFFPTRGLAKNPSLNKCKKIVSDFRKLKANPSDIADLMLFFIEQASRFSAIYGGDMGEQYYIVLENNFRKYMDYIFMNGLLIDFYERIEDLILLAGHSGYGFGDELQEMYGQYR